MYIHVHVHVPRKADSVKDILTVCMVPAGLTSNAIIIALLLPLHVWGEWP